MRNTTLPAVERALAGRNLALLGDSRPEIMTLDGMHFCLVPAGPFVMGDDRGNDNRKPQHEVDLTQPYLIGRHPVSVAQWREYVRSAAIAPMKTPAWPGATTIRLFSVTWHDAIAFCAYLTQRWHKQLPDGFVVSLPSEAEWEKAARGSERVLVRAQGLPLSQLQVALQAPAERPPTRCPAATTLGHRFRHRALQHPRGGRRDQCAGLLPCRSAAVPMRPKT